MNERTKVFIAMAVQRNEQGIDEARLRELAKQADDIVDRVRE
jgi:hypothetical protein